MEGTNHVSDFFLNMEQRARRRGKKRSLARRMRKWLIRQNTLVRKRPPLEQKMRDLLRESFAEDIEKLGRLLDRDLSHWR